MPVLTRSRRKRVAAVTVRPGIKVVQYLFEVYDCLLGTSGLQPLGDFSHNIFVRHGATFPNVF